MAKTKSKKMREHAGELVDMIAPHVENAREKAGPALSDAREKAAPYLAEARGKAAPYLSDARDRFSSDVMPVITAALAAAGDATEDVRDEAKRRGLATAAALKGEVEAPKKTHKLRNLLILLGLGGLAAAVAKKLSGREAETAWQSSYTPPPAPSSPSHVDDTPTATAAAAAAGATLAGTGDDEAAAAPDEAVADAEDEPHAVTTPDDPAEELDVTKE
jgi:hypothetical protein